ncbi:MAG: hypothetical protein ACI8RZ_001759 [Myxococcota bacterium]|jgi:hypothetical protein
MVALILTMAASADPGVLRVGADSETASVVGLPSLSARVPLMDDLEVAAWVRTTGRSTWLRTPLSAAGLAIGRTTRLVGTREVVGWDLGASAGPTVPLLDPAIALSMTPYARRWRSVGAGELGVALAIPAVVQLSGGLAARLPVQAEVTVVGSVGGIRLGVQAGGGVVLSPGWSGFAMAGQVGLVVMP